MIGSAAGIKWSGAAGERAPGQPMTEDTVFRIVSLTKAVGSTAAMIIIDRGKLDLDAPVESLLTEFAKIQVLDGFDGDTPRLRAPNSRATIRHLATRTAADAPAPSDEALQAPLHLSAHLMKLLTRRGVLVEEDGRPT